MVVTDAQDWSRLARQSPARATSVSCENGSERHSPESSDTAGSPLIIR
jgi:hypothetical protein